MIKQMTSIVLALALAACAARAGESLSPAAELPTHENEDSYRPCAAFGEDVYLVAWQSDRRKKGDLVACRVDKSGKVLDAKPFVLCEAEMDQERPRVAFGGGVFLVVWQDIRNKCDYDTYAARVDADGKVLDKDGFLVSGGKQNQCNPRVAFDGISFVVVWEDFRSDRYEVRGARVSPGGKVLDANGITIASHKWMHRLNPDVASDGKGRSLVLWLGHLVHGKGDMSGGVFLKGGKPDGEFKITGSRKPQTGNMPGNRANFIAVTAGPKGYCAAWKNGPGQRGGSSNKANATVFDPSGKQGEMIFAPASQYIYNPDVVWDGSAYVAAWRVQDGYERSRRRHGNYDHVRAGRISSDGKPLGEGLAVAGEYKAPAACAAVASDGKSTTLIAYEQHPKTGDVPIKIGFRLLKK